jgi:hypothetical protein
MSATDQGNLLGLSGDGAYQTAVNNLFAASQQTDNSTANIFFNSNADINTLKAIAFANVADRFSYFLNIISPVYTELQQTTSLAGQLTSWFTIDNSVSRQLLVSIPDIYTFYTDDNFINKLSELTAANYPNQFNLYLQCRRFVSSLII